MQDIGDKNACYSCLVVPDSLLFRLLRSSHLGHLRSVTFFESPLGLHEGGVFIPGVVMSEVRVGGGALSGRSRRGRGRGSRLWCCGYSCRFLLGEVDGNLNISQRILIKYL